MNQNVYPLLNNLLSVGFTQKEANVYLALLEMGKGTVSQIARKAGITRTHGYNILDILVSRNLASVSGKEPKQEYVAESPERIKVLLKKQMNKYKEFVERAENFVPQLNTLHNVGGRPQVKFYEGEEGLKQVYEDTLTSHEPIVSYANFDDMHKTLPDYFPSYYLRRAEKGIHIKGIVPLTPAALERQKHNKAETREMAFVPVDKYYFSPEIDMYDNKIMIASWREKLGIIIESGEIADAMKKIFELAWIGAKSLESKSK